MNGRALVIALVVAVWPDAATAAIVVNASQPITRRVTVQIIQTARDNGSSPATIFGDASQRSAIESAIDTIWAQAGIDVAFLPNIVRYNDTFAYEGTSSPRPIGDLTQIINNARDEGGILNPDSLVLDMFFVRVVPGFSSLGVNSSAGVARIGANGIAAYDGANLLNSVGGRDLIAGTIAHEIGHNLGLGHTADNGPNLMSPMGTTEQLTTSQINTALSATSFARLLPTVLAGDYNGDDTVDAADYTVWRDTLGVVGTGLPADGNNNGRIDAGDYTVWSANFGDTNGAAAAVGAASPAPEPAALAQACIAALLVVSRGRRRRPNGVALFGAKSVFSA